jgi:hypothetical protein
MGLNQAVARPEPARAATGRSKASRLQYRANAVAPTPARQAIGRGTHFGDVTRHARQRY